MRRDKEAEAKEIRQGQACDPWILPPPEVPIQLMDDAEYVAGKAGSL